MYDAPRAARVVMYYLFVYRKMIICDKIHKFLHDFPPTRTTKTDAPVCFCPSKNDYLRSNTYMIYFIADDHFPMDRKVYCNIIWFNVMYDEPRVARAVGAPTPPPPCEPPPRRRRASAPTRHRRHRSPRTRLCFQSFGARARDAPLHGRRVTHGARGGGRNKDASLVYIALYYIIHYVVLSLRARGTPAVHATSWMT